MDVTSLMGTVTYTSLEFCIKTIRVHVSSKTFLLIMFKLHTKSDQELIFWCWVQIRGMIIKKILSRCACVQTFCHVMGSSTKCGQTTVCWCFCFIVVPLILSTVVMISARANISALSSIGLPSFKLSFFLSAFRRFFDDLLRAHWQTFHQ